MFYQAKHFDIEELVDRATFEQFGQKAWMFFNPIVLRQLDNLRDYFELPVTVNSWAIRGPFQFRGFRPRSYNLGGEFSQHRLGNAFDLDIKGMAASAVRQEILTHKDHLLLRDINCIEDKVNWVHFDCRNISERILVFQP